MHRRPQAVYSCDRDQLKSQVTISAADSHAKSKAVPVGRTSALKARVAISTHQFSLTKVNHNCPIGQLPMLAAADRSTGPSRMILSRG